MSKAIEILPGDRFFLAQRRKMGVFKKAAQPEDTSVTETDPLSYRAQLPVPQAAQIPTGFAFMDTSVRMIHEKKDDPNSPLRGIKFNSHGVEFRIEKSQILGATPKYFVSVLTSNKDTQVQYRMTPPDAAFALDCVRKEYDMSDPELSSLIDLFEQNIPKTPVLSAKMVVKNDPPSPVVFQYEAADRTYRMEVPAQGDPKFWVDGLSPNGAVQKRPMTQAEVKFSINKIFVDIKGDAVIKLHTHIEKMRNFQYAMSDPPKADTSGARSIGYY